MTQASILVVEDEIIVAENIQEELTSLGYAVPAIVTSGQEALLQAKVTQPDLVLMDIRLQGELDGVEAAQQIQAHLDIPVVYLTAHADDETLRRARLGRPFGYLLKPFEARELRATVEIALYQHQVDRQLKESEKRYRDLFDGVSVGINRTTPAGQILDANLALVHMLGYPDRESLLTVNAADTYANPEDRKRWQALIEREGVVRNFELQLRRYDGSFIWAESNARAVRDAHRQALYYEDSLEDITERVQAKEALQQRKRELALLTQSGQAFSSTLDLDQVLVGVLEEVRRLLNVVASSIWLLEPPSPPPGEARLSRHGKGGSLVCRHAVGPQSQIVRGWRLALGEGIVGRVARDGESLIVPDARADERHFEGVDQQTGLSLRSILSVPLRVKEHVIGVLQVVDTEIGRFDEGDLALLEPLAASAAIAIENARLYEQAQQEIAERVRAEAERERLLAQIQEQAQRVQQIIDTVSAGVVLLDTVGQVTLANPVAKKNLVALADARVGDTLTHLGGCPLAELLIPPPSGLWHEVAAKGRSFEVIARPLQAGAVGTWTATGEPGGWVLAIRDVTRERQLEKQYQQAQKMEAIGQLTAGIAHDFNNLLTAINGFATLMGLELPPSDPLQELVEKILDSGQRAAELVRQLLAFARKQIIEPQVLDLNRVVAEMNRMLGRIIGEDIELRTILAPDLWPVKVDPTQIQQVIVNLVVNARDAMATGGQLTIETDNVVLDEDYVTSHLEAEPGQHVLLAISDTGIGMSEEVQARIFEPFFTTKELGKGTGLGLATVYGVVRQSGGHIWVHSQERVGTTFRIYLPRTSEAVGMPSPLRRIAAMPSGDETILLVEDDDRVRDLARRVLQGQGYTLLEAENGEQALELATRHTGPIHLLLTDVVMPGISGKDLAEHLIQAYPELKVLFMSGYTDDAIVHYGVLKSGVAFLQKPFSPMALAHDVRQVLDAPRKAQL